nr:hypothetical protein [Parachlamydiaceae bacterium]
MNLSNLASGITLISRASDISEDFKKYQHNGPIADIKAVSLVTRSVLLFLGILELGHTSQNLKLAEHAVWLIDMPLEFIEGLERAFDPQLSLAQKIAAIEKKMLGPVVSLWRSGCEATLNQQKRLRDLSVEEQAKVKIPIYESCGDEYILVGYRPFVLEECLRSIESCEHAIPKLKNVELSCQIAPVSVVAPIVASGVSMIVDYSKNKVDAFTIFKIKKCLRVGGGVAGSGFS